jgi:hypothetical protein
MAQSSMNESLTIEDAMIEAERKAWKALAGYKFWMFGYHAAQWVLLNRLHGKRNHNPFTQLVKLARNQITHD